MGRGMGWVWVLALGCAGGDGDTAEIVPDTGDVVLLDLAVTFTETPTDGVPEAASWFAFSAPDAAAYTCAIDGSAFACDDGTAFVVPMTLGEHVFSVTASGPDGEQGAPAAFEWTITSVFDGDHPELVPTSMLPAPVGDDGWRGIFRINCDFAHSSYDDPIVFPGEEGRAHLHRFYGNMATDFMTTMESLYAIPESSCQGNTVNSSAYWVPALLAPAYDEITGERLLDGDGEPAWEAVPAVVGNDDVAHEVFYYSAGVDDLDSIESIPPGLRMIAGTATTMPGTEQDASIVRWHCQSWESSDGSNPNFSATIPECVEPDRLRMDIFFPNCWNGVDLDSEDHKSHMAYPVNDGGPNGTHCPETHPIPLLRPSYHYAFPVLPGNSDPETQSSRGWRLASDHYEVTDSQAGGLSLHGDWFNAWHPEVLEAILEGCVKGGLDCHDGNLGNGYRLSGTTAGTQVEPEVVNRGMGL
ncbi:MAG: DUF1996 domain-containing protein [Deltaproteobacteria bacterium]|nr:MAG: DUF1996 domain-containing protein [Deltaproteobacteria bacterium]